MDNKQLIASELAKVIDSLDQDAILNLLEKPKSSDLGDIAFPAFSLAKVERKAPQAIAADIAAKIDSTNFEKVYFWDGNVEWDEEDYLEETGMMMPEEAKFQNLWLIGLSFENFWERLSIDEWV